MGSRSIPRIFFRPEFSFPFFFRTLLVAAAKFKPAHPEGSFDPLVFDRLVFDRLVFDRLVFDPLVFHPLVNDSIS
jgi:hypothetical protein